MLVLDKSIVGNEHIVYSFQICARGISEYIRILRLYDEHIIILLCYTLIFHNFNKEALIIISKTSRDYVCMLFSCEESICMHSPINEVFGGTFSSAG